MLSDWCKGVGYSPTYKEFGLIAEGEEGLANFSWGFSGGMMTTSLSSEKPGLTFYQSYTATILPIHLCKWEEEE